MKHPIHHVQPIQSSMDSPAQFGTAVPVRNTRSGWNSNSCEQRCGSLGKGCCELSAIEAALSFLNGSIVIYRSNLGFIWFHEFAILFKIFMCMFPIKLLETREAT
jgi:hypothetical protein